jgi:hypothetical protein
MLLRNFNTNTIDLQNKLIWREMTEKMKKNFDLQSITFKIKPQT